MSCQPQLKRQALACSRIASIAGLAVAREGLLTKERGHCYGLGINIMDINNMDTIDEEDMRVGGKVYTMSTLPGRIFIKEANVRHMGRKFDLICAQKIHMTTEKSTFVAFKSRLYDAPSRDQHLPYAVYDLWVCLAIDYTWSIYSHDFHEYKCTHSKRSHF
ncbi:hypothetical protein CAPTEDRAFT_193358 [Capitella teleta]|uniref:Uncharacterized protein n=1 Tax=Capitella teleta TaxID=283909 RepID=R7UV83_CAPTE|nr:hypothetical protein CAPTEDRAFT_193358 [Capitella teleta]|eukprot:ELU10055.1 hypothetical protein CAPTEDRAFT_193358 [Capitella teleta]